MSAALAFLAVALVAAIIGFWGLARLTAEMREDEDPRPPAS